MKNSARIRLKILLRRAGKSRATKTGMSVAANGALKGKTLEEIIFQFDEDVKGTNSNTEPYAFPLLVKIINAKRKLSVQVHPDDAYAMSHEGEKGKNEAWIVLSAENNAELIIGLKEEVSKEDLCKSGG